MIPDVRNPANTDERKPVILVVDDDSNNLAVVRDCLVELNYTILVAEDGESAVQRADYARPDLILLDIMMPGIDGYETCRRLKSQAGTKDIPVIFMTALAETGHKVKGLEAGAVDYVTKPFQREELLARIAVHLHNRELTQKLQEANDLLEIRVEERTADLSIANRELEDEITERQAVQEMLQEQALQLEQEIEERQIAQDALLKSEQKLRQMYKMEAIGTLAGGIAHDFNNILTAIIGYTDMAQHKLSKDDPASRDLEHVQKASSRAKEMVRSILTFCRQGEQVLRPVQMSYIVEEVLKLLRSTLPTTIEIQRHISTSPYGDTVLADPTQIHQVLMNLGTNAAHAMRTDGGVFSVSLSDIAVDDSLIALYPDLTPGSFLRLAVRDTGHGMEPAVKERIFDPYFTTKEVGEGTGMGLAVVQGIIKRHGGAICVYSEPGHGTVFHIFLPKIAPDVKHLDAADELPSGGGERILFVDDETMLTDLGRVQLESLGYTVTVTSDSREALNLFRSTPQAFDLVITDMTMPRLTGNELARELLAIKPNVPIILCSGFCELINEKQAKEIGIKEFVMKPYTLKSLDNAIRKIFV